MKLVSILALAALAISGARADEATCDRIRKAGAIAGRNVQLKVTGYNFVNDTPEIYGSGTHTCSHVRDEVVDGQPAEVYREQFQSKVGSTDALVWISKASGKTLRAEQDGEVVGKGKGHIVYQWTAAGTQSQAAAASASNAKSDGGLPIYPRGRNLKDTPASAVAKGVPMVLETSDSVATVDDWYKSNTHGCTRTTASQGVKYACPTGSIMIYAHDGKTQIAFVPAMATAR
ncbi:MAG TPA: hypothetical protein VGG65_07255 [Thermoanaerobaculia bacterium]